jgi:hypothetical protein
VSTKVGQAQKTNINGGGIEDELLIPAGDTSELAKAVGHLSHVGYTRCDPGLSALKRVGMCVDASNHGANLISVNAGPSETRPPGGAR